MSDKVMYGTEGLQAILQRHRELLPDAYSLTEWLCASADRYAILGALIIISTILCTSVPLCL